MANFTNAVTDLIVQASSADANRESVEETVRAVCAAIAKTRREALDDGLTRLSDSIASAELPGAAIVAICCGAIVDNGGDPEIALDSILSRLRETLLAAQLFAEACEEAAADDEDKGDRTDDEDEQDDPIERFGRDVAERMPENAKAFDALEPLCVGAVSMLSHSQRGRKSARQRHPNLLPLADDLAPYHERVLFLSRLLNVLDDERIVTLHPLEKKGYRIRMTGVGTNVELFILLADALIGDPAGGWLSGKKPDPVVAATCRDQSVETAKGQTATGAFNLYNWKALQPDGTLPDPKDYATSKDWIWMEGIPSDIQLLEGQRIILLGPPPYARVLQPGRCFEGMAASLEVESKMTGGEVDELLKKIAKAKR